MNELYQRLNFPCHCGRDDCYCLDDREKLLLGDKPIDFKKYYDIKISDGRMFEGRRIYYTCGHDIDSGGNAWFKSKEGEYFWVKPNFLARVNEEFTQKRQNEKKSIFKKIDIERDKKDKLNRKITRLREKLRDDEGVYGDDEIPMSEREKKKLRAQGVEVW
ncbi:hypothetical protein KAT24_00300 [Candidatus Pacearchaeota archaeon]|nr:hypothetical protein [Candidatus Pacearchaeota archaeon]